MKKFMLIDVIDIEIHRIFKIIANEKNFLLLASGSLPDHAHLLIGLNENKSLSQAVKMTKGISARKIFQEFPRLKEQFKTNNLWAKRYNYKEIPKDNLQTIIQYINNQKKGLHLI